MESLSNSSVLAQVLGRGGRGHSDSRGAHEFWSDDGGDATGLFINPLAAGLLHILALQIC